MWRLLRAKMPALSARLALTGFRLHDPPPVHKLLRAFSLKIRPADLIFVNPANSYLCHCNYGAISLSKRMSYEGIRCHDAQGHIDLASGVHLGGGQADVKEPHQRIAGICHLTAGRKSRSAGHYRLIKTKIVTILSDLSMSYRTTASLMWYA